MGSVPPIQARLLGQTELAVGERPLPIEVWPRRAARSLLLLLLTTPGHALHRDQAIETLWPERSAESGLNNFYKALHALRRVLQSDLTSASESAYIVVSAERVGVRPEVAVAVDLDRFGALLNEAQKAPVPQRIDLLWEAVGLYRGDLIADEPYTDWLQARRDQLRQLWQGAALDLASLTRDSDDPRRIVPVLQAVLATEPTNEAVHLALMQSLAVVDPVRALRQYDRCVKALQDELGVDPSPETRAFAESLRGAAGSGPFVAEPRPVRRRQLLPVPPTPLIGREREVREVEDLLLSDRVRLVTLTGPGGIGKTHLALETARWIASEFADGAGFVSLASLRDPGLVLPTIARALGLDESASSLERIAEAIRDADLLLVVDNFEPVIGAAPDLAAMLSAIPGLKALVTSRERLRLRGEHEFEVAPLPTIGADRIPSLAIVAANPAVQLFTERLAASRARFAIDATNATAVVGICRRLDGIPLAIELAAARGRDEDPETLLAGLCSRQIDLDEGPRDLPARLRTMRDAVAWSYDLLSTIEQAMFRRLGVFVGGFDAELVERLNQAMGELLVDSTACLRSLVDKHLIVRESSAGIVRYRMLEPIRDCAIDDLATADESRTVARAHASVFADLADEVLTGVDGAQAVWVEWFDREIDNLRQAFAWAVEADDGAMALRIALGTRRLWRIRGRYQESLAQLEAALALNAIIEPLDRATALLTVARLAIGLDDYARSETAGHEALAIAEAIDDDALRSRALNIQSAVARRRSDFDSASVLADRALTLARMMDDRELLQEALTTASLAAMERGHDDEATRLVREAYESHTDDDPPDRRMPTMVLYAHLLDKNDPEVIRLCEEVVQFARRYGYRDHEATAHNVIGVNAVGVGNLDTAEFHLRAAATILHEMGDRWGWASALSWLALTEWFRGKPEECVTLARLALKTMTSLGDRLHQGLYVAYLGGMCRVAPDPISNTRLCSAGVAQIAAVGIEPEAVLPPSYAEWRSELLTACGVEAFEAAWARGGETPIGVAVEAILVDAGYPG